MNVDGKQISKIRQLVKGSLNNYSTVVNVLLKESVSSSFDCHLFTIRSPSFSAAEAAEIEPPPCECLLSQQYQW